MVKSSWTVDYLTLKGEEIQIKIGMLPHADLKYYPENPRIYSILSVDEGEPSQEEIEKTLMGREHVKKLAQSIAADGGLTDPVFVRDGTMEVLEGNSRLAAYRILSIKNPIKWGMIKCKLLPDILDDDKIFSLLGDYHIIGRQDWAPYEQAGYLYRRHKKYGANPAALAKDLGFTTYEVKNLIDVYALMLKHNEKDIKRYSYYDVYHRSRKIMKARKKYQNLDEVIVKKIKSGEIKKAVDIRDEMPLIVTSDKRIIKGFISGKYDFYEAVEHAKSGGAGDHIYEKLKSFRSWFIHDDVEDEILNLPKRIRSKTKFELGKISQATKLIKNKLSKIS